MSLNSPVPSSHSPIPTFVDTHCHIHDPKFGFDPEAVIERARKAGVTRLLCVGTDENDSEQAVNFVGNRENCWATVGLHPHDAKHGVKGIEKLQKLLEDNSSNSNLKNPSSKLRTPNSKIVAIGECGLDYFYGHSPRETQLEMLHAQIELAKKHNLPLVFHVRDAFDDFWPVFDSYQGLSGVLHSYTDSVKNLEKALERGLYIGVNGIATFTKSEDQKAMFARIPLEKLLLETDAPFLTPVPHRGKVNEPAFITLVAKFLADLRNNPLQELSQATSSNATTLFKLQ